MAWWSRPDPEGPMFRTNSDHRTVEAVLQNKCPLILSLRSLFVLLIDANSELPGVEFAGAALGIFKDGVFAAIQHAEVVVATRVLSCNKITKTK